MVRQRPFPSRAVRSALAFAIWAILPWSALPAYAAPAPEPTGSGDASASFALAELGLPEIGGAAMASASAAGLYLEVFFGQRPTGQLVEMHLLEGRLHASPEDLREIGLVIDPSITADEDGLVALDALPGLKYVYDEQAQRLVLDVPPTLRPKQELGYQAPEPVHVTRGSGLLFNYDSYARRLAGEDTVSVASMLRWFGAAGALESSAVVSSGDGPSGYRRLDTFWSYSDPGHMVTWTAGDLISGGMSWTRPVRLGGIQLRRNFGVRPDLITFPVPRFTGQATLPSSIELLVNNVNQFGSQVDDGPFVIDNFPRINGAGQATLVVRDALGRTTQTTVPIYVDTQRLARGLSDFSFEAGSLRHGYATEQDDYDSRIVASGSYRVGLSDDFTLEGHAQSGAGLRVAGVGGVWAPGGRFGLVNASVARSSDAGSGSQRSYGYQWMNQAVGFDLQTQRRSAGYLDLGDITDDGVVLSTIRSQDRASAWMTVPRGSIAASWLRWTNSLGEEDRVSTLSWSQLLGPKVYATFSMFNSESSGRGYGLTFNVPLGESRDASVGVNHNAGRTDTFANLRQAAPYEGGWGWDVQAGDRDGGFGQASALLRGHYGELAFGADHLSGRTGYFAQGNGSLVFMGGEAFASRRVNDSFAVVSSNGVGGVPVHYENRLYGYTNDHGYLLLPDLRGWQRNRIAIDPDSLGVDYRVPTLEQMVTPADTGAVMVHFDVARVHPALVTLLDRAGRPMAAGTEGRIRGATDPFIVGMDGEAYLPDYAAGEVLEMLSGDTACSYELPVMEAAAAGVARMGPLVCRESL